MTNSIIRNHGGTGEQLDVTPESAGWRYLSFATHLLSEGRTHTDRRPGQETAIVPLSGTATITAGDEEFSVSRSSVFDEMPHIVYAPPDTSMTVQPGAGDFTFAIGSAPAEGKYPVRLFRPDEMRSELRGGGAAYRQVNHVLAAPLPAERLILYEVYVPRGKWSGWAPHRHDGVEGSPYLEEVYYFRLDPPEGFAVHRNWSPESDFDEIMTAGDGDAALVPQGYHSSIACPSSHMFFLNYLAGEPVDEERATPPCFHADYTWIQDDWGANAWSLPKTAP